MNLIPNCSESTFRIDISNLTNKEIEKIKSIWNKEIEKFEKEENFGYEVEGKYLEENQIFSQKVLEAKGDFPYNNNETIDAIIKKCETLLKKNLKTENTEE